MADVSNLRANINGIFETFGVKDKIARENAENLSNALFAAQIVDSASGAIASFSDGAAMPMKSLTVEMSPIQDLHGYDSPWPAGGGKNLFDEDTVYAAHKQTDGSFICTGSQSNYIRTTIPEKYIGQTMTFSAIMRIPDGSAITNIRVAAKINGVTKSNILVNDSTYALSSVTFTPETAEDYVFISYGSNGTGTIQFKDAQLELGSTATDYAPYENICPISGRTEVTAYRSGKNLWNGTIINGFAPIDNLVVGETYTCTAKFLSSDSTYLYLRRGTTGVSPTTDNTELLGRVLSNRVAQPATFTVEEGYAYYLWANQTSVARIGDVQIELGSTATDYEPYDGQSATTQLGDTIYGGTVDVTTGTMTVEYVKWSPDPTAAPTVVDIGDGWTRVAYAAVANRPPYAGKSPITGFYSHGDYTNVWAGKTNHAYVTESNVAYFWFNCEATLAVVRAYLSSQVSAGTPVELAYKIKDPFTVQLNPAQLSTLKGLNNVWSDADSVTVEYVADPKLYIDKKIAEALSP